MSEHVSEGKPAFIRCKSCVFYEYDAKHGEGYCDKLYVDPGYNDYEPLIVTPEDGCTFGKERQASGVNAEATEGGRGQ